MIPLETGGRRFRAVAGFVLLLPTAQPNNKQKIDRDFPARNRDCAVCGAVEWKAPELGAHWLRCIDSENNDRHAYP